MSPTGEMIVSRRGSSGAIVVAVAISAIAAGAVGVFSERGERGGEVGGDGSGVGWDIVDGLIIERLPVYCQMFSGVLMIEAVGSAFILLCCMSQQRKGSSMSR